MPSTYCLVKSAVKRGLNCVPANVLVPSLLVAISDISTGKTDMARTHLDAPEASPTSNIQHPRRLFCIQRRVVMLPA
jgi:hypothetical protein